MILLQSLETVRPALRYSGVPTQSFILRSASPKVPEHSRTTPIAYELASDTCYGLGVVTGVIHFYHETPSAGHPGIGNTYELMKRDFWWPNMKQDAEQYVKGCAACQANKVNTHPLKPTIFPIP